MGMLGMAEMAPLRGANLMMDIAFLLLGAAMIYMSWATYREQR
jgi:hypothetical protein